jgi:uncharacterized damage-inducible protein DinB
VQAKDVLIEAFGRLPELVEAAVDGLSPEQLSRAPSDGANTVAWLVWHLTRVQDSHVAELLDGEQIYTSGGWAARFGLKDDPSDTGYGHSPAQVRAVAPESAAVLVGYYTAVHDRTVGFLRGLGDADLDRVVDEAWDPPVTLGVRLVSVYDDDTQHVGQAAYVRGVVTRD